MPKVGDRLCSDMFEIYYLLNFCKIGCCLAIELHVLSCYATVPFIQHYLHCTVVYVNDIDLVADTADNKVGKDCIKSLLYCQYEHGEESAIKQKYT